MDSCVNNIISGHEQVESCRGSGEVILNNFTGIGEVTANQPPAPCTGLLTQPVREITLAISGMDGRDQ